MRYFKDDSLENGYDHLGEFDAILECLSKIEGLTQNKIQNGKDVNKESSMGDDRQNSNNVRFKCPSCGGENCTPIVENTTKGKDFSASKGCCGALLFGPIGILCGACGKGKQIESTTYWMCHSCGKRFQA